MKNEAEKAGLYSDDDVVKLIMDMRAEVGGLRVQKIMRFAQVSAVANGKSDMTLEEINAEISSMRTERQSRKNGRTWGE